jgi:heptosyltransferase I
VNVDRRQFRDSYRYGLALISEATAPVLRVAARACSRSGPVAPQQWRNGVILSHGHIGDVLYRTCSLKLLKHGLPNCRWSYVTSPSASVALTGNPFLDEVLVWTRDSDGQRLAPGRYRAMATRRFDVALCSDNVGHHRALILALRLGIPNRVAFARKGLSGLITERVMLTESIPHAAAFRRMVEHVTGEVDTSPLRPHVFPSAADFDAARQEWDRLRIGDAEFTVACSATTRQTIGDCPPDFFADILKRVIEIAPSVQIILGGIATDRPLLNSLASQLGERVRVSAGVLGLLAYGALLEKCSAFIGTDSGARHLANAMDIPVFFVRNMGTTESETGAYSPTETDIAPHGEYLSPIAMRRALDAVDRAAVANAIVSAARRQARDNSEGTPS